MEGPTVFGGYWQLPAATAEAFSGTWLHTGDLGKASSSGYIHVVDRKKDMILCGGENVYCTEVRGAEGDVAGGGARWRAAMYMYTSNI